MNRVWVSNFIGKDNFFVLVTALLMVTNEAILGLLVHTGNMPWGLGEWPLWRMSLLAAVGVVVASWATTEWCSWVVPGLLVFAWLVLLVWYGCFAFWYWQIPVLDMRDLSLPPLLGMAMTGFAVVMYGVNKV